MAAVAQAGRPLELDCRGLLYQEFPLQMTWNQIFRRWNCWKRGIGSTIRRIYFVGPSSSERFYLWLLLTVVKGPTSFNDLHTFDGMFYDTFKSACIARGLLDLDEQCDRHGSQPWSDLDFGSIVIQISIDSHPHDPVKNAWIRRGLWSDRLWPGKIHTQSGKLAGFRWNFSSSKL